MMRSISSVVFRIWLYSASPNPTDLCLAFQSTTV